MAKDVKIVETVGFLSAAVALMTITLMNAGAAFAQQPGLAGTSARPVSTNSMTAIASRRSIRDIMSELRRFHGESRSERNVPPGVSRNLTELKHAIRDLIVEVAGAPNATAPDPDDLASRVIERLEREDVPVGDQGGYGTIPAIKFRRPPEYSSWLLVTTTLAIPYGDDTSLYLFETDGTSWRPVLTLESNSYKEISGAQGWLPSLTCHGWPSTSRSQAC